MASRQSIDIRQALSSIIPRGWLERKAYEVKMIRRARKVSPWALVWTMVLGVGRGNERTLAALRRGYAAETGTALVPSSFYDRLTPALTRLLRELLLYVLERVGEPSRQMRGRLRAFTDVLAIDATILRLPEALASLYPGSRTTTSPAAAKLDVVMSVVGRGPRTVKLTSERSKDERKLLLGEWVRNRLLLFDLGYYSGQLFSRIHAHGGYFITRMKGNMNPTVLEEHGMVESSRHAGQPLLQLLARQGKSPVDVEARISFKRRGYAGRQRWDKADFRVVSLWHAELKQWRSYITNVPVEILSTEEIAKVYGLRWEIELVFRQLKSEFRLDQFPTMKAHIVEALIYAALLTLVVSRRLLTLLREHYREQADRLPAERWSRVMMEAAHELLQLILPRRPHNKKRNRQLVEFLFRETIDPNKKRRGGLVKRIEEAGFFETQLQKGLALS